MFEKTYLECYQHCQSPRLKKGRAPHVLECGRRVGEHVAVHVRHAGEAGAVGGVHRHLQDFVPNDKPGFLAGSFIAATTDKDVRCSRSPVLDQERSHVLSRLPKNC